MIYRITALSAVIRMHVKKFEKVLPMSRNTGLKFLRFSRNLSEESNRIIFVI